MLKRVKFLSISALLLLFSIQGAFSGFEKVWDTSNLDPAEDDPWKSRICTQLPDDFANKLYKKNKRNFQSKPDFLIAASMVEAGNQVKEDSQLITMGNFVYHSSIMLGAGDEGGAYLAQHIPTGKYASVKITRRKDEYEAFKNINRLYGCFIDESNFYYIYRPIVSGKTINDYYLGGYNRKFLQDELRIEVNENNEVFYRDWSYNQNLIQALINEAVYCASKGAFPDASNTSDMFVVKTGDKPQVAFIDLDEGTPKSACHEPGYLYLSPFRYFLGLVHFLDYKDGFFVLKDTFSVPAPIKNFVEEYKIAQQYRGTDEYLSSLKDDNSLEKPYSLHLLQDMLNRLTEGMEALGQTG